MTYLCTVYYLMFYHYVMFMHWFMNVLSLCVCTCFVLLFYFGAVTLLLQQMGTERAILCKTKSCYSAYKKQACY